MKKLIFAAMMTAGLGFSGMASAHNSLAINNIDASTERSLVKVCEALKSNKRVKLIRALKDSRIRYKHIVDGLVCNGQDALDFAMSHGAKKTANMVAKRANVDLNSMLAKR